MKKLLIAALTVMFIQFEYTNTSTAYEKCIKNIGLAEIPQKKSYENAADFVNDFEAINGIFGKYITEHEDFIKKNKKAINKYLDLSINLYTTRHFIDESKHKIKFTEDMNQEKILKLEEQIKKYETEKYKIFQNLAEFEKSHYDVSSFVERIGSEVEKEKTEAQLEKEFRNKKWYHLNESDEFDTSEKRAFLSRNYYLAVIFMSFKYFLVNKFEIDK